MVASPRLLATRLAALAGALAAAALLLATDARALEVPELAERTKPSVVLVTVFDAASHKLGTGTGFFVTADGRLVTNVHVIEDAAKATLTLDGGRVVEVAGVLATSPRDDLAVLQAAGPGPYPPLTLGDSQALVAGREIVVVGSPMGLSGTVSTGIVAAVRDKSPLEDEPRGEGPSGESWRVQITAPISPGSSGSPILTREGRVVAVAVGLRNGGQNLNFGIPGERLRALLAGLGDHPALRSFEAAGGGVGGARSPVLLNLGISAAVFLVLGAAYALWQRRVARAQSAAVRRR